MKILYNSIFLEHNPDEMNAEGPYRLRDFEKIFPDIEKNGEPAITLAHTPAYQAYIKETCMQTGYLAEVRVTEKSYESACQAVGLTILASEQNAFAIVRPPGHHAKRERADGFCLFNNMAIAAQNEVRKGKKIFILDIDGHHGDGTQSLFYDSNQVLFCSIHQEYAYPGTGSKLETGEGKGKGFTMNFPLPAGTGDPEFLGSVDVAIEKAVKFKPDIVGVSAGFDGYEKDRLLNLNYTLEGYYQCGLKLSSAFTNIFAVLEGGYHSDIKKCTDAIINGVNGKQKIHK